VDASSREKWCKVAYRVEVEEDFSFFNCECGHFEHSGMVCCHDVKVSALTYFRMSCVRTQKFPVTIPLLFVSSSTCLEIQVMLHLKLRKILGRHIVKRWT
jgi:hypothetical protein